MAVLLLGDTGALLPGEVDAALLLGDTERVCLLSSAAVATPVLQDNVTHTGGIAFFTEPSLECLYSAE